VLQLRKGNLDLVGAVLKGDMWLKAQVAATQLAISKYNTSLIYNGTEELLFSKHKLIKIDFFFSKICFS